MITVIKEDKSLPNTINFIQALYESNDCIVLLLDLNYKHEEVNCTTEESFFIGNNEVIVDLPFDWALSSSTSRYTCLVTLFNTELYHNSLRGIWEDNE